MLRTKLIAALGAALALAAGPVAAGPAAAAETDTHICNAFAEPWDRVCAIPISVYCWIFPDQTICR